MFGLENSPSTWRGAVWIVAGLLALLAHKDPQAVATILGIGATVAGGLGAVTRDQQPGKDGQP
jgi:hypothetical protein